VAKTLTNAVANRWQEGPNTAVGVRLRLQGHDDKLADAESIRRAAEHLARIDDATIELAIRGVRELSARWAGLPAGATLRLTWPLDPDEFER
jgi:hypothetical protein